MVNLTELVGVSGEEIDNSTTTKHTLSLDQVASHCALLALNQILSQFAEETSVFKVLNGCFIKLLLDAFFVDLLSE
jgi:hypothetical protein